MIGLPSASAGDPAVGHDPRITIIRRWIHTRRSGGARTHVNLRGPKASWPFPSPLHLDANDVRRAPMRLFYAIILGILTSHATTIFAATFVVTSPSDQGAGSLRVVIGQANASGDSVNVINFDLPGSGPHEVVLETALPLIRSSSSIINDRPNDEPVTIRRSSVAGISAFRIFDIQKINNGDRPVIAGLILSNGHAPSDGSFPNRGGGIFTEASLLIRGCTIRDNFAAVEGGGIYNYTGNTTVLRSVITGNWAGFGGGLYTFGGTTSSVIDSTISNNASDLAGGGMFITSGTFGPSSTFQITRCTLSNNTALGENGALAEGGGFYHSQGTLTIQNSTISGNTANMGGGASNRTLGVLILQSCTFFGNAAGLGGNLHNSSGAQTECNSTIFRRGATGENIRNSGNFISRGYNLADDSAGGDGGTSPGGRLNGPGDIRNTDPLLEGLANNGGGTQTHGLQSGSPAVNAGDNENGPSSDQRGRARRESADIGAFEFGGTVPHPRVLSVVSRKLHGTGSSFDLDLPLSGPPAVEPRAVNAAGSHQLVVRFEGPFTMKGSSVTSIDGMASAAVVQNGPEAIIDLTMVRNAQTLQIALHDVTVGAESGDVTIPISFLLGDTSRNGAVTSSDVGLAKSRSGQELRGDNFWIDINVSGSLNATDVSQVKQNSGSLLP